MVSWWKVIVAIGISQIASGEGQAEKAPQYVSGAQLPSVEFYQPAIKGMIDGTLRDPYSAVYEWGEPYQITCKKNLYRTPDRWRGWVIDIRVNAKNAYGAYAGPSTYIVWFMNDGKQDLMELHTGFAAFDFKICRKEAWPSDAVPTPTTQR